MNLNLHEAVIRKYDSVSQRIRVLTETWLKNEMYCPSCGCEKLEKMPNNSKMADFFCENCGEIYELKSKKIPLGRQILDGAYYAALERVNSNTNSNLFVLGYDKKFMIESLTLVPKYFLTPNILKKRNPLSENAERPGYIGAYILYGEISDYGKISIVKSYVEQNRKAVLENYSKISRLKIESLNKRGWLMDVLNCINKISTECFTLEDIYRFIPELEKKHPDNKHIEEKIRQQLQFLRDKNFLEFLSKRGTYRKI